MDWKLELITVPVSDADRAKTFYTEMVSFNSDHDHRVSDQIRFVHLNPPGSACPIRSHRHAAWLRQGPADGRLRHQRRARRAPSARDRGQRDTGLRLGILHLLQRPGWQRLVSATAATSQLATNDNARDPNVRDRSAFPMMRGNQTTPLPCPALLAYHCSKIRKSCFVIRCRLITTDSA